MGSSSTRGIVLIHSLEDALAWSKVVLDGLYVKRRPTEEIEKQQHVIQIIEDRIREKNELIKKEITNAGT